MTPQARSPWTTLALALGAAWLLLGSCGGRALSGPHSDASAVNQGEDSSGAAGRGTGAAGSGTGSAGVTGVTGTAGTGAAGVGAAGHGAAGASGGATGKGGATGAAGGAAAGHGGAGGASCGPCPSPNCNPGFMSVVDPAVSCCPVCRPVHCNVVCTPLVCSDGTHLETPAGQCCPVCQPGRLTDACRSGQTAYTQLRAQLIEKYNSTGCATDKECTLVFENNRCISTCGTAFPTSLASNAEQNLKSSAEANCASCPTPVVPPCVPLVAFCSNGRCTSGAGPL